MKQTSEITLTESALSRILELRQKEENKNKFLRVSISSGGCSGFQYLFNLDENLKEDDIKFCEDDGKIIAVTNQHSLDFLAGCKIEFVRDLGASYFKVLNPNANATCGCGASFSV